MLVNGNRRRQVYSHTRGNAELNGADPTDLSNFDVSNQKISGMASN